MVRPLLHKTIFPIIAILSIATAATADAKPRHQRLERTSSAPIVCDMLGCSDRVVALRAVTPAATAAARPTYSQKQRARVRVSDAIITCDFRGCSDRVVALRAIAPVATAAARQKLNYQPRPRVRTAAVTIDCDMRGGSDRAGAVHTAATARTEALSAMAAVPRQASRHRAARTGYAEVVCDMRGCSDRVAPGSAGTQRIVDANGNSTEAVIIGGRPPGCPRAYCGCEASRYVFGEIRPELNLAYNWVKKFPRTAPAPGMVAARSGHVMVLISHAGGNDWLVHDVNSGGGLTRRHVMSINRYFIVDPHASRSAAR
jgi:hypothetical protein